MFNPFKRRKIIRQIYREERRLLEEARLKRKGNGRESDDSHYEKHLEHLEDLLAKIAPRKALDWISILVRLGVATILFIVLVAPPYQYLRNIYVATELVSTSSSGIGTAVITQYIPTTPVGKEDLAVVKVTSKAAAVSLSMRTEFDGMVAGVVAKKDGADVIWTEPENGKRVVKRATVAWFLSVTRASSTLWADEDVESASVAEQGDSIVVASGYRSGDGLRAHVQEYGRDWVEKGAAKTIDLREQNESIDSVQIFSWKTNWVMLTDVIPPPGSSALEVRRVMMRVLDKDFRVVWSKQLKTDAYDLDGFASFFPNGEPENGFFIVMSAKPAVETEKIRRGGEIYLAKFDRAGELTEYFRVTNDGVAHDFWPSGAFVDFDGEFFFSVHKINTSGFESKDAPAGYPPYSGNGFIYALDDADLSIEGVIHVFNETPRTAEFDKVGISHMRMSKFGKRMFVAFDYLVNENAMTEKPERTVMVRFFDLNR